MRRLILAFVLMMLLFSGAWAWHTLTQPFTLTILHFNDLHSRLDPSDPDGTTCTAACIGGIARMRTEVEAVRMRSAHTLVLSSGDNFQGSLYFSLFGGAFIAEALNTLGVDAAGLGNHEFDRGEGELALFARTARFPIIASNVTFASSSPLQEDILPYTVLHQGGRAIGIIGAVTTDTPSLSSPEKQTRFQDEEEALRAAAARLREQGVGIVIALTHVGYEEDLRLAREVPGVDVIVGGHSDTLLSNTQNGAEGAYPTVVAQAGGRTVLVVQTVPYAMQLGELTAVFDRAGEITSFSGEPRILENAIPEDPETAELLEAKREDLEKAGGNLIGISHADLSGDPALCRFDTCGLGAAVADAMRSALPQETIPRIALINSGAIRSSLSRGTVTTGDVVNALPFDDTLVYATTTGATLLSVLKKSFAARTERSGGFLQFSGVVVHTVPGDPTSVCAVTESDSGEAVDPARTYEIMTTSYLAGGGDGYAFTGSFTPLGTTTNSILERALANNQYVSGAEDARIDAQCK